MIASSSFLQFENMFSVVIQHRRNITLKYQVESNYYRKQETKKNIQNFQN